MTGNTFEYRCTGCGTVAEQQLRSEKYWDGGEYPPETLTGICGERDGGCGNVQRLELVEQ